MLDFGLAKWFGQANLAGPHLLKTLELDRNFFLAHLNLGWTYLFTDNLPEALLEFKAAALLGPSWAEAQLGLGYAYGLIGRRLGRKDLSFLTLQVKKLTPCATSTEPWNPR